MFEQWDSARRRKLATVTFYDENFDPSEFLAALTRALEYVGPEARIAISSERDYAPLTVFGWRDATDEELARDAAQRIEYAAKREEQERRRYEYLRSKYGH